MFIKNKTDSNVCYKCTIRLFEDPEVFECEFQPSHKGIFLLEYICEQLDIGEKDYFGLRFVDNLKQRHWLDLSKTLIKQVKDVNPLVLSFRVKFYPADPTRLTLNGKCMVYQQLKRDLRHGRLYCSAGESANLGALIVQEEIGDYEPEIHSGNYVNSLRLALRQTDQLEKKVMELHRKREPGMDINAVYDEFISIARSLETYGIDPHPVKDHRGTQLYVGINFSGISTFSVGKRVQHFRWPEVQKLNFEGKMYIIHLTYTVDREVKKHTVGFKCPSGMSCRYVWRCSIEQMLFFTLPNGQNTSVVTGGGFFSGSKFRYTGRTEREIMSESLQSLRQQQASNDSSPSKRKASSVPATPSSPQGDLTDIRYSSLPRSNISEPLSGFTDQASVFLHENGGPLLETVSEENRKLIGENGEHMSDFYFRESFEHTPDATLTNTTIDGRLAANTYHAPMELGGGIALQTTAINNSNTMINHQNMANSKTAKSMRKFSLVHAFIPSFVFVVLALCVSAVFVLESDLDMFSQVKNWPEMICLRYQYYQPIKEFISRKISGLI